MRSAKTSQTSQTQIKPNVLATGRPQIVCLLAAALVPTSAALCACGAQSCARHMTAPLISGSTELSAERGAETRCRELWSLKGRTDGWVGGGGQQMEDVSNVEATSRISINRQNTRRRLRAAVT